MSIRLKLAAPHGRLIAFGVLSALLGAAIPSPGAAQTVRKQCSEKYQAAKTGGTLNGLAWPQFYSQCAAEAKAGAAPEAPAPATPAATAAPANPLKPVATAPKPAAPAPTAAAPAAAPPVATGPAVFPSAISATYSAEKPGKQRMKTCLDQYNANKATGGNGGLRWIQKGGGYYSQCNARLKS